jgi:hypothetical protein
MRMLDRAQWDRARLALVGLVAPEWRGGHLRDTVTEEGWFTVAKYSCAELAEDPRATPYEEPVTSGCNLLLTSGANAYHQRLIDTAVTAFDASGARIAVGDGSTAVSAGQTDLQGSTRTRKLVDGAPTVSGNQISFVATFLSAEANHVWSEAGVANASTAGVMLNRVVQAYGTKTSGLQWVITGTLSLS